MRRTKRPSKGENHGLSTIIINELRDDLFFLPIDEAVRSSIVCRRWKHLWMNAPRFDFDVKRMEKHLSKHENSQYGELVRTLLHRHSADDLTSCCFKHFPVRFINGRTELDTLVELVVRKYKLLSSLTLECVKQTEPNNPSPIVKTRFQPRIFSSLGSLELTNYSLSHSASSAFVDCEKLKILKMNKIDLVNKALNLILKNCSRLQEFSLIDSTGFKKLRIRNPSLRFLELQSLSVHEIDIAIENLEVLVLENVTCPPNSLKIYALHLMAFHSRCNSTTQGNMQTPDIIKNCSDIFEPYRINIFRYLLTLAIDFDLNNVDEAPALSFVLRSCLYLQTLEITIPVEKSSNSSGDSSDCPHSSRYSWDCSTCEEILKFKSMFWETSREMYNCIIHQLKFAAIRGFSGKDQEVKFEKHLITTACRIRKISIISNSSRVVEVEEVAGLLSLPRASIYLSQVSKQEFTSHGYFLILLAQASSSVFVPR
ncbi:hypothetical protein RIF29_42004 [Crotalaria pallida]|uniref:F-box/LRR-repeat protein 15/At3g58940/PEG3-like LRR domain-containing protein n=1 Tax=Crotalaria pallida TaxID=3830 RepID=A0AAN9HT91_CROPI